MKVWIDLMFDQIKSRSILSNIDISLNIQMSWHSYVNLAEAFVFGVTPLWLWKGVEHKTKHRGRRELTNHDAGSHSSNLTHYQSFASTDIDWGIIYFCSADVKRKKFLGRWGGLCDFTRSDLHTSWCISRQSQVMLLPEKVRIIKTSQF